jgi:hypothetical protein
MKRLLAVLVMAVLVLMASPAFAGTISYVGNLDPSNAQDVALFTLTVVVPGTVDIQSYGYGGSGSAPGGTNYAGAVISPGGFDPYFSLFLGSGNSAEFLISNDDGSCPPGAAVGGLWCGDSTINTYLSGGVYTLALTAFDNQSFAENNPAQYNTLGDGFTGLGNYYDASSGTDRTSAWAVDITLPNGNPPPSVPEPGTLVLLGTGGVFLVVRRLCRSSSTN